MFRRQKLIRVEGGSVVGRTRLLLTAADTFVVTHGVGKLD